MSRAGTFFKMSNEHTNNYFNAFAYFAVPMMSLPEELILMILTYIPLRRLMVVVPLVSKELYRLCHMSALWRKFSLRNVGCVSYSKNALFEIYHRHGQDFHYVFFGGNYSTQLNSLDVEVALTNCANVSSLDIGTNIILTSVSFLKSMPRLKRLVLDFCVEIDTNDFVENVKFCTMLEELSLYKCPQFSYADVLMVMKHLQYMKSLNVEGVFLLGILELQTLISVTHVTRLYGTPDDRQQFDRSSATAWRSFFINHPQVVFNDHIMDMGLPDV